VSKQLTSVCVSQGAALLFTFTFTYTPPTRSCTADTKDSDRSSIDQHLSIFVRKFFVHVTFWQKVCLWPNCVVMRGSQFDELCGLRQTAVSRAI